MGERTRLVLEPLLVVWVRRTHQRQRTAERIDHFLIVPMLALNSLLPPGPAGRQDPRLEMRRRRRGLPVVGRRCGLTHDRQFNRPRTSWAYGPLQGQTNGRPRPRSARQPDRPAPPFDQPSADGQAQPTATRAGGEVRLEYLR